MPPAGVSAGASIDAFAPIVAILRGLKPVEALDVGTALVEAGIGILEVPLNSPQPLQSIALLAKRFGNSCLIGAGTVLDPRDVDAVADAGGRLIVAPDCNPAVIGRAVAHDLVMMPGIATPTEAFRAIDAGARRLKLFPAASLGTAYLKAMREVLPPDVQVWAVGGMSAANLPEWLAAGAAGIGVGGSLYRAGDSAEMVRPRAQALAQTARGSADKSPGVSSR